MDEAARLRFLVSVAVARYACQTIILNMSATNTHGPIMVHESEPTIT